MVIVYGFLGFQCFMVCQGDERSEIIRNRCLFGDKRIYRYPDRLIDKYTPSEIRRECR